MFDSPKSIRLFQLLFAFGLVSQFPLSESRGGLVRMLLGIAGFLMLLIAYEIRFRRLHGGKLSLQSPAAVENTLLVLGVIVILSKNFGF
jgi:hypothetical protein